MNNQYQSLIETLQQCASTCHYCSTACLDEEDVKMMANCIKLDMDCAQICTTVAAFLSRGAEHGRHLLKECAEICNKCANECEKYIFMKHCQECAEACRECTKACAA